MVPQPDPADPILTQAFIDLASPHRLVRSL
jgi:hypothetical protein